MVTADGCLAALENGGGYTSRGAYRAGQQGRFEVAARVHGAVDALLREIGLSIAGETLEERARDEGMAMLRQHMGDQSFATAHQLGAALGVVDAVAIATRARGAEP